MDLLSSSQASRTDAVRVGQSDADAAATAGPAATPWDAFPRAREAADDIDDEAALLWQRWVTRSDPAARDRLILLYAPLVKYVAGRVAGGLITSADRADMAGDGILGLIDAVERFDPDRGAAFEAFAMHRIRGAILDGLRDRDWVPRSVRANARTLARAYAEAAAAVGRTPTDHEVAAVAGMTPDEYAAALADVARSDVLSLDVPSSNDETSTLGALVVDMAAGADPAEAFEAAQLPQLLGAALRDLPERERTVIALYFRERLTLAEIGRVLDLSESHVSRIRTRALLALRAALTNAGALAG